MKERKARKTALGYVLIIDLIVVVLALLNWNKLLTNVVNFSSRITLIIFFIILIVIVNVVTYYLVFAASLVVQIEKESATLVIDKFSNNNYIEVVPITAKSYGKFISNLVDSPKTSFMAVKNKNNDDIKVFVKIGEPNVAYFDIFDEVTKEKFTAYYKIKENSK